MRREPVGRALHHVFARQVDGDERAAAPAAPDEPSAASDLIDDATCGRRYLNSPLPSCLQFTHSDLSGSFRLRACSGSTGRG